MGKNKNSFGNYLKYLRKDYGYTLDELASTIGYSNAYLSQIEKGRKPAPSFEMLEVLSKTLKTPYSGLLKKAGYEGLAEGQYYKELYSDIHLNQTEYPIESEKMKRAKDLMSMNYNGVIEWAKDDRFNEDETINLVEHFSEMLLRYKEVIEKMSSTPQKWASSKDYLKGIWSEEITEEEVKRVFLAVELKKSIDNLTNWIEILPSTMLLTKKNNT